MQYRAYALILVFVLALFSIPIASLVTADEPISMSEKRPLKQYMDYEAYKAAHRGAGLSEYLSYLESYLLDQFPKRDLLRQSLARFRLGVLRQLDHHGYFEKDGHLGKLDPILNERALDYALSILENVASDRLSQSGHRVFALIPDKNVYLTDKSDYPSYAYDAFFQQVQVAMRGETEVLSLLPYLSIDDYYKTDPHWDQGKLFQVANAILAEFGFNAGLSSDMFQLHRYEGYDGTYKAHMAGGSLSDTLSWLRNDAIDAMTVYDLVTGEKGPIYQEDKLRGTDAYDLFLGGAKALLTIHNPHQENGRQLIVFRDSFGSSLIPLLALYYEDVIVVDLRYIQMTSVAQLVEMRDDGDALFLFSTSVLNSPGVFKK